MDLEEVSVSFPCVYTEVGGGGSWEEGTGTREKKEAGKKRERSEIRNALPEVDTALVPAALAAPVSRNCWINNCGTEQKNREHRV